LICYIYLWFAFMLYPLDMQLGMVRREGRRAGGGENE
jgi:hypothetical protein